MIARAVWWAAGRKRKAKPALIVAYGGIGLSPTDVMAALGLTRERIEADEEVDPATDFGNQCEAVEAAVRERVGLPLAAG